MRRRLARASRARQVAVLYSFEKSKGILRNQKFMIGLDSFSKHSIIFFALLGI